MIPRVGQTVAFIANSAWIVPATITRTYPDGKVDLSIINILQEIQRKVTGLGMNRKVEEYEAFIQKSSARPYVREVDPCSVIQRHAIPLDRVQSGGGLTQTHTDEWSEVGKSRLPRLTGIVTSLIGGWFDPTQWNYKIYCLMHEFEDRELKQKFEQVERIIPFIEGEEYFTTFQETFRRWFKESFTEDNYLYQSGIPHMWDRCEIQAVEKHENNSYPGLITDETIQAPPSNLSRVKTHSRTATGTKPKQSRSRKSLPKSRKRHEG